MDACKARVCFIPLLVEIKFLECLLHCAYTPPYLADQSLLSPFKQMYGLLFLMGRKVYVQVFVIILSGLSWP